MSSKSLLQLFYILVKLLLLVNYSCIEELNLRLQLASKAVHVLYSFLPIIKLLCQAPKDLQEEDS